MSKNIYRHERRIAELAVQRASLVTKRVLRSVNLGGLSKSDSSPVTVADFAAQALLISAIRSNFPLDSFVGEEDAAELRRDAVLKGRIWELVSSTRLEDAESEALLASPSSAEEMMEVIDLGGKGKGGPSGRVWMMDPIDGTAAYLRGQQYAVALALVEDGKEKVGVLGCPNLDIDAGKVKEDTVDKAGYGYMLSAAKGLGAVVRRMGTGALQAAIEIPTLRGGPKSLEDLHVVDSALSSSWRHDMVRKIALSLGATYPGTEMFSSHMRYVAQLLGGGDVQMRIPTSPPRPLSVWDHAGIQLIFTEAGGTVTDLDGKDIDFGAGRTLSNNWGIIASRSGVHAELLRRTRDILTQEVQSRRGPPTKSSI